MFTDVGTPEFVMSIETVNDQLALFSPSLFFCVFTGE